MEDHLIAFNVNIKYGTNEKLENMLYKRTYSKKNVDSNTFSYASLSLKCLLSTELWSHNWFMAFPCGFTPDLCPVHIEI